MPNPQEKEYDFSRRVEDQYRVMFSEDPTVCGMARRIRALRNNVYHSALKLAGFSLATGVGFGFFASRDLGIEIVGGIVGGAGFVGICSTVQKFIDSVSEAHALRSALAHDILHKP